MRGAFEAELRPLQDSSDVLFPEFARFGMTLERMKDWEDKRAV